MMTVSSSLRQPLLVVATAALLAACAEESPLALDRQSPVAPQLATLPVEADEAIATLRSATARYHDLDVAIDDGFVLLHPCEVRPDEGPVGIVYVHPGRLMDGLIDPETPDALVYEPSRIGGPKLVGVEFAIPYALWTGHEPPEFLGATFQPEDEFGVFGLHVWIWRQNPEGMFAEANPRVSCDPR